MVIDRYTGETFDNPSPPVKKRKTPFRNIVAASPLFHVGTTWVVKRGWYEDADGERRIGPMAHTHTIRAELELEQYSREYFAENWDVASTPHQVLSCPMTSFIDVFGLYSNSYRSMMGFYMTPCLLLEYRLLPLKNFPYC